MCTPTQDVWQPAGCVSCELVCVFVSLVRVVIICLASTHTALVSSPSLTVLHLPTYIHPCCRFMRAAPRACVREPSHAHPHRGPRRAQSAGPQSRPGALARHVGGHRDTIEGPSPYSIFLLKSRTNLRHEALGFLAQQVGPIQDMERYLPPEARLPLRSMFSPENRVGVGRASQGGAGGHGLARASSRHRHAQAARPQQAWRPRSARPSGDAERSRRWRGRIVGNEIVDALNLETEATPQAAR